MGLSMLLQVFLLAVIYIRLREGVCIGRSRGTPSVCTQRMFIYRHAHDTMFGTEDAAKRRHQLRPLVLCVPLLEGCECFRRIFTMNELDNGTVAVEFGDDIPKFPGKLIRS